MGKRQPFGKRVRRQAAILWRFRFHFLCAVGALIFWETTLIKPFRVFVVMVHEVCHATASLMTGGEVIEMPTAWAESGHTLTRGGWPPVIISAGYVGSALIGAALGLAGALMQGLFRNPLAAPGIVGTSSGAAFGALIAIWAGLSLRSLFYLPLFAVLGAFASLLVVVRIATRNGVTPVSTLLLSGVALTALLGAANGWIIAQAWSEWEVARRIAFWMMGGITDRGWVHVWLLLPCVAVGAVVAVRYAADLDVMLEGDESARALGLIGDTRAVAPLERLFAARQGPDHDAAKQILGQLTGLEYAIEP